MATPRQTLSQRPAESAAGVAALVAAVAVLFGVDLSPEQTAALLVVLGALPGVVTRVVTFVRQLRSS